MDIAFSFKNILCYCSTRLQKFSRRKFVYLKTSYVIVQLIFPCTLFEKDTYLKTSYVIVQLFTGSSFQDGIPNLKTSYVIVQLQSLPQDNTR